MWCVCDLSVPEHTYVLVLIIILQTRCQIESQVPGCIYLKSLLALFLSPTLLFIQVIHTYIHSTRLFAQSKIAVKSVLELRTIFHMELLEEAPQLVFFCIVSCSCTWKRGVSRVSRNVQKLTTTIHLLYVLYSYGGGTLLQYTRYSLMGESSGL